MMIAGPELRSIPCGADGHPMGTLKRPQAFVSAPLLSCGTLRYNTRVSYLVAFVATGMRVLAC